MNFSKEEHGSVLIEKVDITRATYKEAEEFGKILKRDIQDGWSQVIIDLSECEFIDSTFLSTLVTALKLLTDKGGDLRLISVQTETTSMLELTRTTKVLQVFTSREEAIRSFR